MFDSVTTIDSRSDQSAAFEHIARGFFEHHGIWDPSVVSMTKTSDGPVGPGTTGLEGRRFGPSRIVSEIVVTAFEPDRRFGFETTKGPMSERLDCLIEARPGGSRVRLHIRLAGVALPLRIMEPLMRPMFARNLRANTERMRLALDAAASGGSQHT
ncbi:MAG TPA: SRPBCC family protein [Candidatus Limnocylindrales bacterium]